MGSHPINALKDTYVVTLRIGGPALTIIPMDVQDGTPEKNLQQTRHSRCKSVQCAFFILRPNVQSKIICLKKKKKISELQYSTIREQFQSDNEDYKVSYVRLKVTHLHWAGWEQLTRHCTSDIISSLGFQEKKADRRFSFTRNFEKIPLTAETVDRFRIGWGVVAEGGQTTSHGCKKRTDSGLTPATRSLRSTWAVLLGLMVVSGKWSAQLGWEQRLLVCTTMILEHPCRFYPRGPLNNLEMTRGSWKLWKISNILTLRRTQELSWN